MNSYTLTLMNDEFDNPQGFVNFCWENQHSDIELIVNQESHDLQLCDVYKILDCFVFKSVTIHTANPFESHNKYNVVKTFLFYHWLHSDKFQSFDFSYDYKWNGNKIFGCFYARPSAPRLGLASFLFYNYPSHSLIKTRFNQNEGHNTLRKNFEFSKLYSWDRDCWPALSSLMLNLDQCWSDHMAYDYNTWVYDFSNPINYYYQDILIDVVCEAHCMGKTFYPTEKIARAILCRKPFIVMAPAHYLKYLRQMGFKTFYTIWDESYDNASGSNRYFEIRSLINRLVSTYSFKNFLNEIDSIVDHNFRTLINQTYKTTVQEIVNE